MYLLSRCYDGKCVVRIWQLAGLSRLLPRMRWAAFFVTAPMVVRWHRNLVAWR